MPEGDGDKVYGHAPMVRKRKNSMKDGEAGEGSVKITLNVQALSNKVVTAMITTGTALAVNEILKDDN